MSSTCAENKPAHEDGGVHQCLIDLEILNQHVLDLASGAAHAREDLARCEAEVQRLQSYLHNMVPEAQMEAARQELLASTQQVERLQRQLLDFVPRADLDSAVAELQRLQAVVRDMAPLGQL